jgi:predicted membrane protein
MNEIIALDRKGLRNFGLTTGGIIVILFAGLLPWLLDHNFPVWPWILAAALWLLAAAAPMALQPIYKVWMKFGAILGAFNTRVLLGIMFYLIITPMALIMRLLGKDALHRTLDDRPSYRVKSKVNPPKNMERPF